MMGNEKPLCILETGRESQLLVHLLIYATPYELSRREYLGEHGIEF